MTELSRKPANSVSTLNKLQPDWPSAQPWSLTPVSGVMMPTQLSMRHNQGLKDSDSEQAA